MKSYLETTIDSIKETRDRIHKELADLLLEDEEHPDLLQAHKLLRRAQIVIAAAHQDYNRSTKVSELIKPLLSSLRLIGYAEALKDVYIRDHHGDGDRDSC
jgi:hypothetical protein